MGRRETRPCADKNFVPILEYEQQERVVADHLNEKHLSGLINHSDRKWTRELGKMRTSETVSSAVHPEIKFFDPKKLHGVFSNFYASPITIKGKTYATVEHYFQARKFSYKGASKKSLEYGELIRKSKSPGIAKMLAAQKKSYRFPWMREVSEIIARYEGVAMRKNWESIKETIMMIGLFYKFSNLKLKKLLLDTGYSVLIENSPYDYYWGIGKDGSGKTDWAYV